MGRVKELYNRVMQENDGIPEGLTIADLKHMEELNIYHWKEYERERERKKQSDSKQKDC
jgi:hypothetical protein